MDTWNKRSRSRHDEKQFSATDSASREAYAKAETFGYQCQNCDQLDYSMKFYANNNEILKF